MKKIGTEKPAKEILTFKGPQEFEKWLAKYHAKSTGIWIRYFKKASGMTGITYAEARRSRTCDRCQERRAMGSGI